MKNLLVLLLLIFSLEINAQQRLTTFILTRHAEKVNDGSKNPRLTEEGQKRAGNLVLLLQPTPLHAIYSTKYMRTVETVTPIAKARALAINEYAAFDTMGMRSIFNEYQGKTVLICGHSNNIPFIANYLTGTKNFKDFEDEDFSNLLIITAAEIGKMTSVTWLHY